VQTHDLPFLVGSLVPERDHEAVRTVQDQFVDVRREDQID
jgi:hypothetical protein